MVALHDEHTSSIFGTTSRDRHSSITHVATPKTPNLSIQHKILSSTISPVNSAAKSLNDNFSGVSWGRDSGETGSRDNVAECKLGMEQGLPQAQVQGFPQQDTPASDQRNGEPPVLRKQHIETDCGDINVDDSMNVTAATQDRKDALLTKCLMEMQDATRSIFMVS